MAAPAETQLPAREREMIELYQQGLTYGQIAQRCQCADMTAWRRLQPHLTPEIRAMHQRNYRKPSSMPPTKAITELYVKGHGTREIATLVNIRFRRLLDI